ncbi:MAG TPA: GIY-YIG nuclease family protein [Patescibacteria group bacterium]|nr:GIY-YIG nuclease family protein [Patescibacteria group bacterium]
MWYVYVLQSLVNGRHFTGSTNDIERRLSEHNSGKTKYTSQTRPFKLIYKETYSTRLEARQRELFLKTGKGRELLKVLMGS